MAVITEQVRQLLHQALERDEGRVVNGQGRHVVYDDATGKPLKIMAQGNPTLGYGRLLSRGLSEDEADYLLDNDIREGKRIAELYPWFEGLSDARQGVIVALLVNMGPARFNGFVRMQACLERAEYAGAARELLDSDYAHQVDDGPGGKFGRADRYARVLQSGVWT